METPTVLIVALALLTVPLVGCIGDDSTETDGLEQTATDPVPELPPTAATLHGPDGAAASLDDALDNTSLPVGASGLTGFGSFEPTIGVTSDGALFMSNSEGMVATGHSSIVRSTDQGATWEDITPRIADTVTTPPTTFDPYVHVDQLTDRVYNLDMEGLNCNYIQWSDDGGESFTGHPLGCGQPPVLDHPTLFTGPPRVLATVGYENVVYLCVNRLADAACAISLNGGVSFSPFKTVFPEPGPEAETCGGLHGHGTTGPDGRAYLGKVHCGVPTVAVTEDDGLTWQTTVVSPEYTSTRHDVELAVDAAGNVYALWSDGDFDLQLSVSTDHAQSWSEPMAVATPGIETSVFPAIAAGDEGKIAFVYYGTESTEDIPDMDGNVTWTAYLATLQNATTPDPVIATAPLHGPADPIARGPCDDDNRCDGVGDFVDIVIDMDGRPWAGLIDVCHDACDAESGNDEAIGLVGTLTQGFPLRGDAASLPVLTSLAAS